MVQMRRKRVANVARNEFASPIGVIHDAMKIIGGSQPQQGCVYSRRVRLKAERIAEECNIAFDSVAILLWQQRPRKGSEALSTGRRCSDFDAVIGTGNVNG